MQALLDTPLLRSLLLAAGLGLLLGAHSAYAQGGSCDAPGGTLDDPSCDCVLVDGDTTLNGADFWAVELEAGATYTFTFCDASCGGASATFDSVLSLYAPTCGAPIASNDDACGLLSQLVVTADVSGTHVLEIRGFGGGDVGPYTLGYREGGSSPSCMETAGTLDTPTTECQFLDDELCGVDDAYYLVDLINDFTYTFTLCDASCPGAGTPFDSLLELRSPDGTLVASDGDACGDDGELVYTPAPPWGDGTYCLRVNRAAGSVESTFTLGWFVECEPPIVPAMAPDSGNTSGEDCTKDVSFVAESFGTGPFDWEWTIVAEPGNSATPSVFLETTDAAISTFPTTLMGDGSYDVSVVVTNDCGQESNSLVYVLSDLRGPDLTCTLTPCASGGPPPLPVTGSTATGIAPDGPAVRAFAGSVGSAEEPQGYEPPMEIDLRAVQEVMLAEVEPGLARQALARKLGMSPDRIVVRDGRDPSLSRPPLAAALGCASPCNSGSIMETHPFYDVFLSCTDGSFTARTGAAHSVTISSGSAQNVIFGGQSGNPGTSDVSWYVHDSDTEYTDPPGGAACAFDPPDSSSEPNSRGLEMEWASMSPMPGVDLTLREEIVAFGSVEADSGIRLTLGASNSITSTQAVTLGVRWQIDYQNASDDGPLYARVQCDPFMILDERSTEHEFDPATEIDDFYRIQNNSGTPIFANFTSSAPIVGFPDTTTPDRLIYGRWPTLNTASWHYITNEGANADGDSATLVYYGFDVANGITLDPGESFTRSVVIFTQGEEQDCGTFVPGLGENAESQICPDECVRIGATAVDNCSETTVVLIDSSAGAPPCVGNPCDVTFPDEGVFTYTWEATDAQGNSTRCTSTITVVDDGECNRPPTCGAGGPYSSDCSEALVDGATADDPDGDELSWVWSSSDPNVLLNPSSGVLPAGVGARAIPPVTATLDPSVPPCGVEAVLSLTVTDTSGAESTCQTTVSFNDTEPPVLAGDGVGSGCLWSPNHKYVCVDAGSLGVVVEDSCSEPTWRLVGCSSNQPDEAPDPDFDFNGDGHFEDDCVVSPDGRMVCFRSERAGAGATAQEGRIYTLSIVATDECGNESEPINAFSVSVAHDQSPEAREGCLDPNEVGIKKNDPFPWEAGAGDPGDDDDAGDD